MPNQTVTGTPLFSLIRELRDETKALIHQEIQLAKTELSEKASRFGKNGALLAIGGVVAYAGLLVFLAALGIIIAYGLEAAGLDRLPAQSIGLGIIGLLVLGVGAALAFKALATFKKESLAPERTVQTLQHLAGTEAAKEHAALYPVTAPPSKPPGQKRSSQDLQHTVTHTQNEVGERMEELSRRMTPQYMNEVVRGQVRFHPLRSVAVAFGTGLASAAMIVRRFRKVRA